MPAPKTTLKRHILNYLAKITGNSFCQWILDKNMGLTRFLLGIDSGTWVETSGEFAAVKKAINRGGEKPVIFDVGANKGQFIDVVVQTIPPGTDVVLHSFEPSQYTFNLLSEKYSGNAFVNLYNFGMGESAQEVTLYSDAPGSGRASLTRRDVSHEGASFDGEEVIQINCIDDFCDSQNISRIDLLKIDVEGHELDVLKGAARMFSEKRIGVVCFEFSSCNVDTRIFIRDFFQFFQKYDMSLSRITASGYLKPISHYSETLEQFGDSNYIAS